MQDWLPSFELNTGTRTIKPYDPTIAEQVAALVRPRGARAFQAIRPSSRPCSASAGGSRMSRRPPELLQKAGFTKQGNQWMMPDGKPFAIRLMVEGDNSRRWRAPAPSSPSNGQHAGHQDDSRRRRPDQRPRLAPATSTRRSTGAIETWGGHPDSPSSSTATTRPYRRAGKTSRRATCSAGRAGKLDAIIAENRKIAFDSPKVVELGERVS